MRGTGVKENAARMFSFIPVPSFIILNIAQTEEQKVKKVALIYKEMLC
jgi:hypothetical protein